MQITIQKVWPNDQNKANGKFVGTDGRSYFIEAKFHGLLREGMTLDPPSAKPSEFKGKTNYWLPKGWSPVPLDVHGHPHVAAAQEMMQKPASAAPAATAPGAYVPEMEKQGYIMCSVMMKILADAQTQGGHPPNTEDMALFAQCATAVWRDHLKGKV